MATRRYTCCDICRGNDNPFLKCTDCRRLFHIECLNMRTMPKQKDWICGYCHDEKEDGENKRTLSKELKLRHLTARNWNARLLKNRKAFLEENRSSFEAFSTKEIVDSYLKSRTRAAPVTDKTDLVLPEASNPSYIINCDIRAYQREGINKLCSWYLRGIGGILADEMGLGKTLQTISLIACLKHELGIAGPHLVITPLAVLQNWANEMTRFCPSLTFKKLYGNLSERQQLFTDEKVVEGEFDVYLTTYETICCEEGFFADSWEWSTVTIDEGHRIKNENAALRQSLNKIKCPFRLLLTGTPLQNNMHELWALLNYLLPEIFKDSATFDSGAQVREDCLRQDICEKARLLLENTMMIRRIKSQVEKSLLPKIQCKIMVPMTDLQVQWYRSFLERAEKDVAAENEDGGSEMDVATDAVAFKKGALSMLSSKQLLSIMFQLRKVVNHPKQIYYKKQEMRLKENNRVESATYAGSEFVKIQKDLLPPAVNSVEWQAEETLRKLKGESLIKSCGKLAMLDRLLLRLKAQGNRVLLFSQFTETLDVLQEYVEYRFGAMDQVLLRLDGTTNRIVKEMNTRAFNAPDSPIFIYLISTKAGGMGINLATADSVILYESSWNPQVDLQAQDRAHRIGQKKQVVVYRLVTVNTFEERVCQMAERKLVLDHVVIAKKDKNDSDDDKLLASAEDDIVGDVEKLLSISDLLSVLHHGSDQIFTTDDGGVDSNDGESSKKNGGQTPKFVSDEVLDAHLDAFIRQSKGLPPTPYVPPGQLNVQNAPQKMQYHPPQPPHQPPPHAQQPQEQQPQGQQHLLQHHPLQAPQLPQQQVARSSLLLGQPQGLTPSLVAQASVPHVSASLNVIHNMETLSRMNNKQLTDLALEHQVPLPSSNYKARLYVYFRCKETGFLVKGENPGQLGQVDLHILRSALQFPTTWTTDEVLVGYIRFLQANKHFLSTFNANKTTQVERMFKHIEFINFTRVASNTKPLLDYSTVRIMQNAMMAKPAVATVAPVVAGRVVAHPVVGTHAPAVVNPVAPQPTTVAVPVQGTTSSSAPSSEAERSGRSGRKRGAPKTFEPADYRVNKTTEKRKRNWEDFCFCCNDGGDLLECGLCPKVYHLKCIGLSRVPAGRWSCPWHSCCGCQRTSSNSGGIQFRCLCCPIAYCFDCWPTDLEMKKVQPSPAYLHRFEKLGFDLSKNIIFFRCDDCKDKPELQPQEADIARDEAIAARKEAMEERMRIQKEEMAERMKKQKEEREKNPGFQQSSLTGLTTSISVDERNRMIMQNTVTAGGMSVDERNRILMHNLQHQQHEIERKRLSSTLPLVPSVDHDQREVALTANPLVVYPVVTDLTSDGM